MLEVIVPAREYWDETLEQFTSQDERVLQLEHSLISISKWESKWRKPFLNDDDKSEEESRDYVRCMTMTKGVPPEVYYAILPEDILRISEYIKTPQTATTINEVPGPPSAKPVITSEVVYYWMIAYKIPQAYEKWHFSRLLTLIRVCEAKSKPPTKMNKADLRAKMRQLNEERRAKYNTRG